MSGPTKIHMKRPLVESINARTTKLSLTNYDYYVHIIYPIFL